MRIQLIVILFFLLSSCSKTPKNNNELGLTFHSDSVELAPFEVKVELDEEAEERIKDDNETIIVFGYFTAKPIDRIDPRKLLKGSGLYLTKYSIELKNKRVAKFEKIKFHRDKLKLMKNQDVDILINVVSGRKSSESNLLQVETLQKKLSRVKGKTFVLEGKLIK